MCLLALTLQQFAAVLAEIFGQEQRLPRLHVSKHFNCVAHIFDPERQIMRRLSLGASILQNGQCLQKKLWVRSNQVNNHEDHLLLLVWQLDEVNWGEVEI